jgi:hypothetical protein
VGVEDALALAGRPAREAHRRSLVLVELRVLPFVGARRVEQLLVGVLDDEHVLDVRVLPERVQQREEASVDDDRPVVRVRGDVAEVAGMEAEVQRVQDVAAARDAEVGLHVLVVVPAQRRDAVAALEAELLQADGELLRPPGHVRIRVAVETLVGHAGHDLLVPEERLRAAKQRRERELVVHHQAVHR